MVMIIGGVFLGVLIRLVISFLGGGRVESLITACLIMSGASSEFSLGFLSTFIGMRGFSIPMDILQPINVQSNPFLASYINRQVMIGEAPSLIKSLLSIEILINWMIWLPGLLAVSYFWQGGMKQEFSGIVLAISPYLMSLIWVLQLCRSHLKGRYLIGMVMVGSFGLFITNSGVGQFGVLIALSLLFMGWEGLSIKELPEQNWKYPASSVSNSPFSTYTFFIGALSAIYIGCPSGPLVELYEHPHMSSGERFWAQVVASKVSDSISLLLWFYYGASRGATSDVLDKTIEGGLVNNPSMVLIFMVLVGLCNYTVWNYIDVMGKVNWVWSKFLCPIKVLNIGITLLTLIFYIPLGVPIHLLPLLVVSSLLIREVLYKLKLEPSVSLSMVSIIPLAGIYLT
jgi:hypothetical protein